MQHISGSENFIADKLSTLNCESNKEEPQFMNDVNEISSLKELHTRNSHPAYMPCIKLYA